ncbi:hypothetical protein D9611_012865 [Ephemerocybe angulata]|uniref:Protein kinase domain-containing protein n=1 Tax=Ephemerocybe angulata TaxID=980116 RepID=A0A8H5BAR4_9AGAR|nr:hypothetical protein D9611_012865 [Tulosesus angulatus]
MIFASVKEENKDGEKKHGLLMSYEEEWVRLYYFLEQRGYRLRRRYHPEWVPSWILKPVQSGSIFNEDAIQSVPKVVDAERIETGAKVMLKMVNLSSEELLISSYVSSPPRPDDPRNHCVRLLDVILIPACETHAIMVMPLLYEHSVLPFRRAGELIELANQLTECLEFLHEHKIAHRDYCRRNVLVDPKKLIISPIHPFDPLTPPDGTLFDFKWVGSRWAVRPNQYSVIDFGYSKTFEQREDALTAGIVGQDDSVPEMSLTVPYNPFPVDVYHLGNMLLSFCDVSAVYPSCNSRDTYDPCLGIFSKWGYGEAEISGSENDTGRSNASAHSSRGYGSNLPSQSQDLLLRPSTTNLDIRSPVPPHF